MNPKDYLKPDKLERYSFLWSEARLIIAAIALFIGGVPPVLAYNPIPALYGLLGSLLTLFWIISGAAAGYLLYRWKENRQKLFGGRAPLDTLAFFISVVSGLNLGIAGILGTNIGMSITMSSFVFTIVALLYLAAAVILFLRWNSYKQKIF